MNAFEDPFENRRIPLPLLDPVAGQEPLGVPVSRVFRVLRRRGWIAALVMIVVVGTATVAVLRLEPSYTSQAAVLVETRKSQLNDLQVSAPEAQDTPSAVQTQIDIMRSPSLVQQVVRSLDLTNVPEFNPPEDELMTRIRRALGATVTEPTPAERELTAAQILTGKLTFASELRSSVVKISAETDDATRSAAIVNELARQYLNFNRDRKFATLQRAVSWFQTRLSELAIQVQQSQAAVQRYREEHNLADTPVGTATQDGERLSVAAQQLADVNRQLTVVIGERAKRDAQVAEVAERLRRQGRPAGLPDVPPNLMADLNAIRAQEETLRQAVDRSRKAVAEENAATSQMAGLLAQAQTNRAMYDSFLTRATQLANAEGVQEPDAELLSAGTVPNGPSSPKRGRLLAVAFGFALLLGLGLALLADRLRTGLSTLADVEGKLGLRALTVTPRASGTDKKLIGITGRSPDFRDAAQRILGNLALAEQGGRQKVVMVTSALPQEGKSVLAYGLAESAAGTGQRVLLIEADLRRPALLRRLRLQASRGLADMLAGEVRLEEVVQKLPNGVYVLPSSGPAAGLQPQLGTPQMRNLLQAARGGFDLVLIDTPAVLPVVDALLVAQHVDAVILAARWEHTPVSLLQEASKMLHQSGAHVAGVVLTRVRMRTYDSAASEGAAYVHKHYRRYYTPSV
jgi:succinoglycan biosynthesis transport protein ExoP